MRKRCQATSHIQRFVRLGLSWQLSFDTIFTRGQPSDKNGIEDRASG